MQHAPLQDREVRGAPRERRMAMRMQQCVSRQAAPATVAVRKGVHQYDPVMEPHRDLVERKDSANHSCASFTRSRSATRIVGQWTPMFLSVRRGAPAQRHISSNI